MNFNPNKSPVDIISEGALVVHILGMFILVSTVDGTKIVGKSFIFKKILIVDIIHLIFTSDVEINKYGIKCGTSLRFWGNKGWISPIDPYGWFQWCCRY